MTVINVVDCRMTLKDAGGEVAILRPHRSADPDFRIVHVTMPDFMVPELSLSETHLMSIL